MNFDESFPRRVSMARNAIGLTQSELAKKVGIVPRQIAAYEGGEARPRINALHNLAAALGTTPEWLTSGIGDPPNIAHVRSTITLPLIPVITFVQAANLWREDSIVGYDYIPAPRLASESVFAVKVEGDSMQSSSGISFPDGSTVIFDPDADPNNGDFVLCKLNESDDVTFKQLIIDQGKHYLHPLNPRYMNMPVNKNISIMGVAIELRNELSHDVSFLSKSGMISSLMESISDTPVDMKNEFSSEHIAQRLDRIESMLNKLINKDI